MTREASSKVFFTVYGNCQADVLSNLLAQSPEFAARYSLARLRPCFNVPEAEIQEWATTRAAEVDLLITQKLRKGWRGGVEVFDTDWLATQCAPNVRWFEWSDMYYSAYEPHMTYPMTFPRQKPSDYMNILHMLTFANGLDWQRVLLFYTDPDIFPKAVIEMAHQELISELSKREADCSIKIAPFIDRHWREERLFLTFNHPGRRVVSCAANQILDGLQIANRVPQTGYFGFPKESALPLLASFDAFLAIGDNRPLMDSFFLQEKAISAADYFGQWQATFAEIGVTKIREELVQQQRASNTRRAVIDIAARHLGLPAA